MLLDLYCSEAISDAKLKHWNLYLTYLSKITRMTVKGVKSVHEKNTDDIIKNIKLLDVEYCNGSFPVRFVAADLNTLPNVLNLEKQKRYPYRIG